MLACRRVWNPDDPDVVEQLNARGAGHLPALLGFSVVTAKSGALSGRLDVRPDLMAVNGYLHAATVVALADTCCGYGCWISLPEGAANFTTIELKSNFLSSVREGGVSCDAMMVHGGRTTQVWDATVTAEGTGRRLALFRCTQAVLWPR